MEEIQPANPLVVSTFAERSSKAAEATLIVIAMKATAMVRMIAAFFISFPSVVFPALRRPFSKVVSSTLNSNPKRGYGQVILEDFSKSFTQRWLDSLPYAKYTYYAPKVEPHPN